MFHFDAIETSYILHDENSCVIPVECSISINIMIAVLIKQKKKMYV
jgi:hypothetical protein